MTVHETMLVCVNSQGNNNKFYHITFNENTGNLTKRWGRVGTAGTTQTENGKTFKNYQSLINSKQKRGYKEVDILSNTDTENSATNTTTLHKIALKDLAADLNNKELTSLIELIVKANRHKISDFSGGQITVDDSGIIRTALGVVSNKTITQATKKLNEISKVLNDNQKRAQLTEQYLTLIPQKIPTRERNWAITLLDNQSKIDEQKEFLRTLKASIATLEALKEKAKQESEKNGQEQQGGLFNCKLNVVKNKTKIEEITKFYKEGISHNHPSSHLKIKNIYELTYPSEVTEKFDKIKDEKGNVRSLWHGTHTGNILSILREGLFCPPPTKQNITYHGRMFGDGVYFAPSSTKSLNYSYGTWDKNRYAHCFMFLADVILGNEYWPNKDPKGFSAERAHFGKDKNGNPFNSISVKKDTSIKFKTHTQKLANDEIIVWNTDQILLRYLIEFIE